jgi:hypothetical protein
VSPSKRCSPPFSQGPLRQTPGGGRMVPLATTAVGVLTPAGLQPEHEASAGRNDARGVSRPGTREGQKWASDVWRRSSAQESRRSARRSLGVRRTRGRGNIRRGNPSSQHDASDWRQRIAKDSWVRRHSASIANDFEACQPSGWHRNGRGAGLGPQVLPWGRTGTATTAPTRGSRHGAGVDTPRTVRGRGREQREEQDQRGEPACPPRLSSCNWRLISH